MKSPLRMRYSSSRGAKLSLLAAEDAVADRGVEQHEGASVPPGAFAAQAARTPEAAAMAAATDDCRNKRRETKAFLTYLILL